MSDPTPGSRPPSGSDEAAAAQVVTHGPGASRWGRGGAILGVAGVVAAAAAGFALGRSGGLDLVGESAAISGPPDAVAPFSACPGGPPIGELHRGDRVFLTGRDEAGTWLELRSPAGASDRVWLQAEAVGPDSEVDGLPVHDCTTEGAQLAMAGETITTLPPTTVPGATTTTAGPSTTTTIATTTSQPGTTTPTTSGDTAPPSVTALQADVNEIYTNDGVCGPRPRSTPVEALVTDASEISSVELGWSFPGANGTVSGTKAMTLSGGRYRAVFGPFPDGTLAQDDSVIVTWTVRAVDAAGNPRQVSVQKAEAITVHDECPG